MRVLLFLGLWAALGRAGAENFDPLIGKTFSAPGPNCFATALKATGLTPSFRGMDEREFREYRRLFCREVATPQPGTIGVFEKPGFGFIHAYVYVSETTGLQKPGVDYAGKTPIAYASLEAIDYVYRASTECRRYSPDIEACANRHYFLTCGPPELSNDPEAHHWQNRLRPLEIEQGMLLESALVEPGFLRRILRMRDEVNRLALEFSQAPARHGAFGPYLRAQLRSLEKQNLFLTNAVGLSAESDFTIAW